MVLRRFQWVNFHRKACSNDSWPTFSAQSAYEWRACPRSKAVSALRSATALQNARASTDCARTGEACGVRWRSAAQTPLWVDGDPPKTPKKQKMIPRLRGPMKAYLLLLLATCVSAIASTVALPDGRMYSVSDWTAPGALKVPAADGAELEVVKRSTVIRTIDTVGESFPIDSSTSRRAGRCG
jgi:hypothetical protein